MFSTGNSHTMYRDEIFANHKVGIHTKKIIVLHAKQWTLFRLRSYGLLEKPNGMGKNASILGRGQPRGQFWRKSLPKLADFSLS